ncbi:11975_t:CDS:2, partial [Cetraspora pellucida]
MPMFIVDQESESKKMEIEFKHYWKLNRGSNENRQHTVKKEVAKTERMNDVRYLNRSSSISDVLGRIRKGKNPIFEKDQRIERI